MIDRNEFSIPTRTEGGRWAVVWGYGRLRPALVWAGRTRVTADIHLPSGRVYRKSEAPDDVVLIPMWNDDRVAAQDVALGLATEVNVEMGVGLRRYTVEWQDALAEAAARAYRLFQRNVDRRHARLTGGGA